MSTTTTTRATAESASERRPQMVKRPSASGKGWYWPVAIVLLLVAGAGANIALMVVATRDASFAVEPDYYQKALRWDETVAQEAENAALGWSVAMRMDPFRHGPVRVVARVTDGGGKAVRGARVGVEAFHSARASQRLTATLTPEPSGGYFADLPLDRPGLWEVRVRVERGEQVFTQTIDQVLARMP